MLHTNYNLHSCYWYQRYLILKAIHNSLLKSPVMKFVVTDIKDTSFWKQFTTIYLFLFPSLRLLLISKIPHFESNSQHCQHAVWHLHSCYWYQRYLILKAIHNKSGHSHKYSNVVTDIKDTSFWKQFTTKKGYELNIPWLLLISKIPHFESNSQHRREKGYIIKSCYWYQRYLILKAIHNTRE